VVPFSGSRGPHTRFLVLTLVGVSTIWWGFVNIGHPMPAVFDAPLSSLWMHALPYS